MASQRTLFLLFILLLTVCRLDCVAAPVVNQNVLILNSYHPGYAWSDQEQAGIITAFSQPDSNWLPNIEYLDLKRFPQASHLQNLTRTLREKYTREKFSVVIAMDNQALAFAVTNQEFLFKNTPIVFCGINNYSPAMLKEHPDVTGIAESPEPGGTMEIMLKLHPGTREILVLLDYTITGLAIRQEIEALQLRFSGKVSIRFTGKLSMDEILKELEQLPENTLVLLQGFSVDSKGQVFGLTEVTRLFSQHSKVPVYATYEQCLGSGIVGGKLLNARVHGANTARLAKRILDGEKASAIPIVNKSDATYMFDYEVLKHYGIPLQALPADSIIINRPVSFFSLHKKITAVTLAVIITLILIILLLIHNMIKRRRTLIALDEKELRYQTLIKDTGAGYFRVGLDGCFQYVNDAWLKMHGFSSTSEIIGRHFSCTQIDADLEMSQINIERLMQGEPMTTNEFSRRCQDGSIGYHILSAGPFKKDNKIAGLEGFLFDITEQKKATDLIKAERDKLELVTRNIGVGLAIISQDYRTIWSNAVIKDIYGDTIDKPCYSIYNQQQAICSWCGARQIFAGNSQNEVITEASGKDSEGNTVWSQIIATPIRNEQGEITSVLEVVVPITGRKLMEQALRESEEKFYRVFQHSPALMSLYSLASNKFIDANEKFLQVLKYSNEDVIGKTLSDLKLFVNPEQRDEIVRTLKTQPGLQNKFIQIRTKAGTIIDLLWSVENININGDNYLISSAVDITEARRIEQELLLSERRFHNVIDASGEFIFETDIQGNVTFISDRVRDILGYAPAELVGKNVFFLLISPEEADRIRNIHRELAAQNLPIRNMDHHCLNKDGQERILSVTSLPLFNATGEMKGYQGTVGDITEQQLAEKARQASEEKYRLLFNEMQEGFALHEVICDEGDTPVDYRFLILNPAFEKLTGLKAVDLIGKSVKQLMPEIESSWIDTYGYVAMTGKPVVFENYSRPLKKYFQVSAFSPRHKQFAVLFNDITERKQIEESLRESESRFRNLFNNMLQGFAYCQLIYENNEPVDFIYLSVNNAFIKLTGYKDIEGKKFTEVISTNSDLQLLSNYITVIARSVSSATTEKFELYLKSAKIWLSASVYDAGNDCFITLFDNITERKQAEQKQKLLNDILESINSAGDITNIIRRIVLLIKQTTGIEAIGLRLKDGADYPYYETTGFPDHFVQRENSLCARSENNKIILDQAGKPHLECICGDVICGVIDIAKPFFTTGGSFWSNSMSQLRLFPANKGLSTNIRKTCCSEGYESVALIPLRSDDEIIGLLQLNDKRTDCFNLDMIKYFEGIGASIGIAIQRMQTEDKLQKEEERYRTVANFTYDWEYWISEEGHYKYISPAFEKISGYAVDELVQNPHLLGTIVHPSDQGMVLEHMGSPQKHACPFDFRIIAKNGDERWLGHRCQQVYDNRGNSLGWRGSNRDITARKSVEAQLRQSQKMEAIGTLAGGIAHDFNNILGAIYGFAGMAQEELPEGSVIREWIDEIFKASERAKNLVQQILAFSRHDEAEKKPLMVVPIIKEVVKLLHHVLPSTIHLKQNIKVKDALILADATQIHQVLMNLCTNAGYAMREHGGTLTISLNQIDITPADNLCAESLTAGTYLELKVSDTGQGIDDAIINKIFDPFFTTKKQNEGTGLGLSVVHGIVHNYSGHITVNSDINVGTTFSVYLPFAAEQAAQPKDKAREALAHGNERILIIDDQEYILKMMRLMLSRLGYIITATPDPLDALASFKNDPFAQDMIITDQTMPDLTGFDLAKKILSIRPDIPIILCTGFSDLVSPEAAKNIGIRDFLMKPIALPELAQTVRNVFDKNIKR